MPLSLTLYEQSVTVDGLEGELTEADEVLEVVGEWLAVLDHVAAVLPVCKVVLAQVGARV